jgi:sugar/nucleoside kinase (ribokinase family)
VDYSSSPFLRFVVAGRLQRDYIITPNGKPYLDILGGGLIYAAVGLAVWETNTGLISRIGEDFPQEWIAQISRRGFDTRGIHILPENIDVRTFTAYSDVDTRHNDNPISHFARLNLPFPKSLLGYTAPVPQLDSRNQPSKKTIRMSEIPDEYLDATAAHICPLDYLSHSLLPSVFRQGQVTTITLDPSSGYMNPIYWDDIPALFQGLTAILCSEEKMTSLFSGRSTDLWEMAETLASYGCEIIVIKRKGLGQLVYEHSTRMKWIVPAYPARVIDPTGAGDAFSGGFLAGYRATYNPLEGAMFGNISASLVVEGSSPFYALDAMPGLARARVDGLRDMVRRA